MQSIRSILAKIYPKLRQIEENPTVTIRKLISSGSDNPFTSNNEDVYSEQTVTCIYSEEPAVIKSEEQLVQIKYMYLYIKKDEVPSITHNDILIFNNIAYKPQDIQDIFGLWKVRISKI